MAWRLLGLGHGLEVVAMAWLMLSPWRGSQVVGITWPTGCRHGVGCALAYRGVAFHAVACNVCRLGVGRHMEAVGS
jgi:hypothetical protein